MHKNLFCGRARRWVLAAVLLAMLGGCRGDEETTSAGASPALGGRAPPPPPSSPAPLPQPRAATIEWTVPTTQTNGAALSDLAGYRIHYGKSVLSLDNTIEIRNPSVSSYVIEGLAPGTYYFAVTAFTSRDYESERSNAGRKEIT
jgi:hypothetical protein